jgi:mono/diheme cytochrome c family protein
MTRFGLAAFVMVATCTAQNRSELLSKGEQVFARSCATGYCHGTGGAPGGAPRLAGRGFDQNYISTVVTRGIPDTGMQSFATTLSRADLLSVIGYVAMLNGVADPNLGGNQAAGSAPSTLEGEAARGARLFAEATRGFGRCSTCHEVGGVGIPVASPIVHVPSSATSLKALATPNVKTGSVDGESMPVLVLSEGKRGSVFYDLTSVPPVQRNAEPGSVQFTDGSTWRHSSVTGAYNDTELDAILAYLKTVFQPQVSERN